MDDFKNMSGFMDLLNVVDSKIAERSQHLSIGSAILFMVFAISLMATKRMGMDTAFGFSSFMTFMTAFFLLYMGFINMGIFVFTSIMLFAAVAFLIYKRREMRG